MLSLNDGSSRWTPILLSRGGLNHNTFCDRVITIKRLGIFLAVDMSIVDIQSQQDVFAYSQPHKKHPLDEKLLACKVFQTFFTQTQVALVFAIRYY